MMMRLSWDVLSSDTAGLFFTSFSLSKQKTCLYFKIYLSITSSVCSSSLPLFFHILTSHTRQRDIPDSKVFFPWVSTGKSSTWGLSRHLLECTSTPVKHVSFLPCNILIRFFFCFAFPGYCFLRHIPSGWRVFSISLLRYFFIQSFFLESNTFKVTNREVCRL